MAILDPGFGREVFEVDPAGGPGLARHLLGHSFNEGGWAAGRQRPRSPLWPGGVGRQGVVPVLDMDAIDPLAILRGVEPRADAGEAGQIVTQSRTCTSSPWVGSAPSCFSWRASRQVTPMSPKLSTTQQKISQSNGGGAGHVRASRYKKPVRRVAHRLVGF